MDSKEIATQPKPKPISTQNQYSELPVTRNNDNDDDDDLDDDDHPPHLILLNPPPPHLSGPPAQIVIERTKNRTEPDILNDFCIFTFLR